MNKYKLALIPAVLAALASPAANADTLYREATVLSSTPVYRHVEVSSPVRHCWDEQVARYDNRGRGRGNAYGHNNRNNRNYNNSRGRNDNSHTPEILGAIVGGAIGNAVGSNKSNKRVGAVVGALLGGSIASDITRNRGGNTYYSNNNHYSNNNVRYDTVQRCSTTSNYRTEERFMGYDVVYYYDGREYQTRMQHDPGPSLRLRVDLQPVY